MSEEIENISHQKCSVSKSISDHKNESSKLEPIHYQKILDLNQSESNESIKQISNPSNIKDTEKIQTIRKCIRKGSQVCYTDLENITVLRRIPERDTSKLSAKSNQESKVMEKIDSYRSGESLFKTFTFEQTRDINDPETVKCIQFWKSVMKKNLAPIKCTLIESNNNLKETKKEKTLRSTEDKKSENKKSEEKKDKLDITVEGTRIWSEALKEIQKRKLDQLRLYVKERCQFCTDPFTKDLKDEWSVKNFEDQKAEIISLNDWKPKEGEIDVTYYSNTNRRKQFTFKQKKQPTSKTVKTRTNDNFHLDQTQREYSNNQIEAETLNPSEGVGNVAFPQEPPSILKSPSRVSSISESSRKKIDAQMTSVNAQASNIKCASDSTTDLCPHKMVARNSKTSFVEIARKNMLTQGFPHVKDDNEDCVCTSELEAPCTSEACPIKTPKEVSTPCICGVNLPWSQAICRSWKCRYHRTVKRNGKDNEDNINFKGHPPIKKVTSTCISQEGQAWNEVECDCEICSIRSRSKTILKDKNRKNSPLKTTKSRISSENLDKRRQSEDKASLNAALEIPNEDKEKGKSKLVTMNESNRCICPVTSPCNIVTCQSCKTKDTRERSNTNVSTVSAESISFEKHEDCVCKDAHIQPIDKVDDCNKKAISVEYPPPCVCPKDLEKSKHEHFVYFTESCTMKKIDRKCLCKSEPAFENKAVTEGNADKCIFNTVGSPESTTCRSLSDHSNDQSSMDRDEEDSEQELCICKGEHADIAKDKGVICNRIHCLKNSVAEDGTATKDECVCANLDLSQNVDRNYCYICGYYDCASVDKKTANTKVYEKMYTDKEDMDDM